jgi:hypothetical protein
MVHFFFMGGSPSRQSKAQSIAECTEQVHRSGARRCYHKQSTKAAMQDAGGLRRLMCTGSIRTSTRASGIPHPLELAGSNWSSDEDQGLKGPGPL